ncbi:IgA1 protease [Anopheles sinensis]|uniref:IgA1 protease n=1 Tax=Anopheles sinensis TaxID=74873 RepID=A0A084WPN5_ANOSI|nr:IgA1 protease [Anopheles sinensis]
MLCEQSPAAGTVPHHRRRRHRSAESGHGGGGGGDGGNALALESFRASLRPSKRAEAESSSGEPAAPIDIDVPTIGAIGTPPDECKPVVVTASSTSSSSFSSSSSCTLSSLSPASEADQPSVTLSVTRSELARSLSVPCRGGDRVFDLLATPTFRNTVSFPLSGDQFRQLYSMQEPGGEPEGAPQEKRPLLLSPPESQPQQELLAEPPPKKMAGPVPTYAEVVGGSSSASAAVQDKPPSGQVVKPAITITSTEDDVEVVVESGLSNTVEPPMRGKPRTLKYYVRRHRSAFHKE